jgi:saccharopine dehydrogenase-like NADP-dependent oxidoreductase
MLSAKGQYTVAIIGSGQIGSTIHDMLTLSDQFVADIYDTTVRGNVKLLDVTNDAALHKVVKEHDIVVSAVPYNLTERIAREVSVQGNKVYLDLTEDLLTGESIVKFNALAGNGSIVVPHCGLAPGAVSIIAADLMRRFDKVVDVVIRVGALPIVADNDLQYYRSWSTSGLVNEYIKDCPVIEDGQIKLVSALGGLDKVVVDGKQLESFYTSGGAGTLVLTALSKFKVDNLCYKTLRYPGHNEKMLFLLNDLCFRDNPQDLMALLDKTVPSTRDDVVHIHIRVTGTFAGQGGLHNLTYTKSIYGDPSLTAIKNTTASGVLSVLYWVVSKIEAGETNDLSHHIKCEDIPYNEIKEVNRWAVYNK